jgi:hypothetical protein
MPTPHQALHQAAFRRALAHAGEVFTDSTGQTFAGMLWVLRPDDPRIIEGSPDRLVEIVALTADLPASPALARGAEITAEGGTAHRIAREPDADPASGLTHILATPY